MKTAIFAVSRDGVTLAERIRENIESDIFTMEKYKTADSITFHKLSEEVESQFLNYRAIIFVAAAGIATVVTLAMLTTVNWVYENGYNLDDKTELKDKFNSIYKVLKDIGPQEIFNIIKNRDINAIKKLIEKFV